jgi:hypothetical protein
MISRQFEEKGWHIACRHGTPRLIAVFGERSSGTNFVKRVIGRNSVLSPTEDLGWKHGVPSMAAIPPDIAIVVAVRDARAWSLSMHAKPWHCPPAMQRLGFSEFIRSEWATVADEAKYFPQVKAMGGEGFDLQIDRHPITGARFENLYALRRLKLQAHLSFLNRGCTVVFCRMEAVQAAPEAFVDDIHKGLDLPPPPQAYRPVVKRLGSKFWPAVEHRPATPARMPEEDLAFLRANIDPDLERALGYSYED